MAINTKIGLDLTSAARSVRDMTKIVRSSTTAWKAQEAMLKSAGNYAKAAEARYNGLGKAVEEQRAKLNHLKEAQSQINTTNAQGRRAFQEYQIKINQATTQLAHMTSQQERARSKTEYYNSGLANLQKSYKSISNVSRSYVERLEAEGKADEANQAKLKGLKSGLDNLNKQYKIQAEELDRVARSSGKNSEAYHKQEIRLNSTATKVAKTKKEFQELNSQLQKEHPTFGNKVSSALTKIKNKLLGVREEEERTSKVGSRIKDFVAGNVIANGLQAIGSKLWDSAKAGYASAQSATALAAKWKNIGVNDKGIEHMAATAKTLKENTNMSGQAVADLETKFYSITKSTKQARALSLGVGSLADKLKMSQQQADAFSGGLSRIEASGKVTSASLGRLEKQAPGLTAAMAKASGMSRKSFNSLLASGKMTSQQFNQILTKASKDYDKNAKAFDSSAAGAQKHIKQSWADTEQAVMKPMVAVMSALMASVSKTLNNSQVQKLIERISKALAGLAEKLMKVVDYIAAHQKDFTSITGSLIKIVSIFAGAVWDTIKDTVINIAKAFNGMSSSSKKPIDPIKALSQALQEIAKHRKVIQTLGTTIAIAFASYKTLHGIYSLTHSITDLISKSNKFVLITTAIIAVGTALVELYKHNKKFREFVNGIGRAIAKFAGFLGKLVGNIVKIGKKVVNAFKKAFKPIGKFMSAFWKGLGKTVKGLIKAFGTVLIGPIGAVVVLIIKHWNKLKKPMSKLWTSIKKAAKKTWNAIKKVIIPVAEVINKTVTKVFKVMKNFIIDAWDDIKKATKKAWNLVKKFIIDPVNAVYKFTKKWFGKLVNWIGDKWDALRKITHRIWGKIYDHIHDSVVAIFKAGTKWIEKLKDGIHDRLDAISKHWGKMWRGMKNFFSDVWDDIKKKAQNGINGVIGIINGGIRGINSIIHTFGGKNKTIDYIGKVHFATGTGAFSGPRRPITKPTRAILNDGNDSPQTGNKEGLIRNGQLHVVEGRNTEALLLPGDEILNASELATLASMSGVEHFAKGTGLGNVLGWAEGVGSWIGQKAKGLVKWFHEAMKIVAHPIKTLGQFFSFKNIFKGLAPTEIAKGLYKFSHKQVKTWWSKLWSMASERLDGGSGDASGLLAAVEKYGHGHRYVLGTHGPTTFDCSGLVMYALKKAFGIDLPAPSGQQYRLTKPVSNPKPGDLVFYGPGGSTHVGVYAGGGRFYSAMSDSSHPNIGMSSVYGFGEGTPHFRRVPGLSRMSSNQKKFADKGLAGLIKKQVGSGFWKFLSKLGDMFNSPDVGPGVKPKGDHMHWLKQAGIPSSWFSAIEKIIDGADGIPGESGWDPHAGNPQSGAYGIPQSLPASKMASAGSDWRDNPITQLRWMKSYIKGRYGNAQNAWMHKVNSSTHWYANGGIVTTEQLAHIAENNQPEAIIPMSAMKRSRGWELLGKTAAHFMKDEKQPVIDGKDSRDTKRLDQMVDRMDTMIALLGQLLGVNTKQLNSSGISNRDLYDRVHQVQKGKDVLNNLIY